MVLNIGYIELGGGGVTSRIYYDKTWLEVDPTRDPNAAPLVNGPRGYCLDLTNATNGNVKLVVYGLSGTPTTVNIGQGDPVTGGPASGRSRTAADMAALGYSTRGNVGQVSIGE